MKTIVAVRGIILHGDKVFLVKHPGSTFYSLPGGKIEENETLKAALERELIEELGVKPVVGDMLYIHEFVYPRDNRNNIEFFFLVKNGEDYVKFAGGEYMEEELEDYEWFPLENAFEVKPVFLKEEFSKLSDLTKKPEMKFISVLPEEVSVEK